MNYWEEEKVFLCCLRETTELIRAQKEGVQIHDQAQEVMKVRDEFVANVTHELKTPLNGIKGHTQYLQMTKVTKEQEKELEIIENCCVNMEKLITNILDFSKLEAGKFTIEEHEFSFENCIQKIIDSTGRLIENKGLHLVVNIDPNIPKRIVGDELRLTQILNNLLSNAMKFTQRGCIGVEAIYSMQQGNEIEIFFMVMDTGVGIDPEKKDLLFESFRQANAGISRNYGGVGLGLAITKQLVELMNGNIRIESELGKGSTISFSVRMKLAEGEALPEKESTIASLRLEHMGNMRELFEEADRIDHFGSPENQEELHNSIEKLSICLEMENYEKAELLTENMKNLISDSPEEIKKTFFRVEMMIRKEDGNRAEEYFDQFQRLLKCELEK